MRKVVLTLPVWNVRTLNIPFLPEFVVCGTRICRMHILVGIFVNDVDGINYSGQECGEDEG